MTDSIEDQIEGLKKTLVERTIGALEGALAAFTGGRYEDNQTTL